MSRTPVLEMRNIAKAFGKFYALKGVDLTVWPGEIHALMGENGAGKSTLMKILAGAYTATSGEILIDGQPFHIRGPKDALSAGITLIYQEMQLAPNLTVAENIFLGSELSRGGLVQRKEMVMQSQKVIDRLGAQFKASDRVMTLTIAEQQQVEIARALHRNSRILVMDEPTAALSSRETHRLFELIMRLRDEGMAIIYISHRMAEVYELSDRVSVLRDGCHIDTIPVASVDRQGLINMMVGREMGQEYPKEVGNVGGTILEVKNLSRGILQDISFEVKSGEVFGISGLVGAGRTELARAILGIDKPESGEVYVRGKKVHYRTFADAIRDGLGLIPEDRKLQGLVQIMSVKRNTTLVNMKRVLRAGVISSSLEEKLSKEYADKLHVVTPSMETEVQYLSGGNQQKVVIAKWLFQNSEILFLDEPTRGIDVGAKAEIYRLINRMAKEGKTIIMISSEMPELLGMCDRIMVMHEGHKMGELNAAEATQAKIMALCS